MRTSRLLLRQVRRALLVAFAFAGLINVLALSLPVYILHVFESVVLTGSIATLLVLTALVGVCVGAWALLELVRDRILLRSGLWLDHELGRHVLDNGIKAGQSTGELGEAGRAVERLRGFVTSPAILPVFDVPFVPLFVAILFLMHPALGGLTLAAAAALLAAAVGQLVFTARLQEDETTLTARAARWWQTMAQREGQMRASGIGPGASRQWERLNRGHVAAAYALGKRVSLLKVFARTVRVAAQIGVYAVGAWLVVQSQIGPGALVASAILMAKALGPLEQLVGSVRAIETGFAAYRKLKSLPADARPPIAASDVAHDLPADSGHVALSEATYFYPGRRQPAVRNVTLSLEPGESLGIVGPNGSGKSTLAGILAGAYVPANGSAELDGVAISKWQCWTGDTTPVGYVPDDPVLIEGTVHDNIVRFTDDSCLAAAAAARRAGVQDTLSALSDGFETQVGPFGSGLSLRERRAVSLARALHGDPRMLVLDEPETGRDGAGIRSLIASLEAIRERGTRLVIVTQDPRLLALCDKIALMSEGTLKAFGHRDLVTGKFGRAAPLTRPPRAPGASNVVAMTAMRDDELEGATAT